MTQFNVMTRGERIEIQCIRIQTALDAVFGVFEIAEDDANWMCLMH